MAIHNGVPQKVYKHRCEICYQQTDCFIEGAIPKHTVKIILPWCNEVAVVRHRGEQCYPCPDCERAAVTTGGKSSVMRNVLFGLSGVWDAPTILHFHKETTFAMSVPGGVLNHEEEVFINSWENISSRLHTRLRQHYARHHHCFLNQVYKTPEEVS